MATQAQHLGDAVRARQGELGISQRELAARARMALTTVQDIQSGNRSKGLRAGTKSRLEQALEWGTGSIDRVLNGGEPLPRSKPESLVDPELSPLLEELLTASQPRLAEVAEMISTATENPADGDQWLQAVLRLRNPRDEVEIEMMKVKDDPKVIWAHIIARRERMRDEALERKRLGRSG